MGDRWNAMTEPVMLEDYALTTDEGWHDMLARPTDVSGMRLLSARPTDVSGMRLLSAFGGNGLLDVRMMDSKLSEERAEMFPGQSPMDNGFAGTQVAQGWNGIPPIPAPRLPPSTRGYDAGAKDAMEGMDSVPETLDRNSEFRARARQAEIDSQFEIERRRSAASQSPDTYFARQPKQPYITDQNSIAPVRRGDTHKSSGPFGQRYYVDRNGDGASDLILQYRNNKTYADFGDEEGLSVYNRQRYRPAPPPPAGRR
jgi:hypothetical protein